MPTIHPLADVNCANIGTKTRIWQYSIILPGAIIGSDCNICAHTLIESDVIVGDNVTIKSGVFLWDGTRIKNNVFVGPNVTFTNDLFPRSKHHLKEFKGITIEYGASVGANATLLPGITIGAQAMVGAGAVVIEDVPERAVVVGNPAKIIRYIDI